MIESLNAVLSIFIYVLLIGLLVIGIILGIKLIITIDKVNKVVDNIDEKVHSLDTAFSIITNVSNYIGTFGSRVTDIILLIFEKVKNLKKRKDDNNE